MSYNILVHQSTFGLTFMVLCIFVCFTYCNVMNPVIIISAHGTGLQKSVTCQVYGSRFIAVSIPVSVITLIGWILQQTGVSFRGSPFFCSFQYDCFFYSLYCLFASSLDFWLNLSSPICFYILQCIVYHFFPKLAVIYHGFCETFLCVQLHVLHVLDPKLVVTSVGTFMSSNWFIILGL